MNKLDIRGVREERFEGLMYHQGATIRYKRVEASNSCARILIFNSFFYCILSSFFFLPLFAFLT
jgi:hypothetical protein